MCRPFHLVIPCLRESGRLGYFLQDLANEFQADPIVDILVVDDGSDLEEQRNLAALVAPFAERWQFVSEPLFLSKNLGKGGAVREGWKNQRGARWLVFADADGSCSAAELKRLMRIAQDSAQTDRAWFACRVRMLGRDIDRKFHRHAIGRVYASIVTTVLQIPVYDSQCGLKIVGCDAYEAVSPLLEVSGFAFDVELLAALVDSGLSVEEVPIDWREHAGGKVRLVRDSWRMLRDTLRLQKRRDSEPWKTLTRSYRNFRTTV
jgi:glycosyltransferase involved in cell wall biosynthesis